MGLDTSHDAWHGSYSTFGEWRRIIASAAGFPPLNGMVGFGGAGNWNKVPGDKRLVPLLNHSDCDGEISPSDCAGIAASLQELIDRIPDYKDDDAHPALIEYWRQKTKMFHQGCLVAVAANESIKFR